MSKTMTRDAVLAQRGIDGLTAILLAAPPVSGPSAGPMADGYATSEPVPGFAVDHRTMLFPAE